jgi:hypothetical protein
MNKVLFLLLSCITSSLAAQSQQFLHHTTVDQNGNQRSYYKAKEITIEEEQAHHLHIADNTGSLTRDGNSVYEPIMVDYAEIKKFLEDISGRSFEDKIFLIEYTYANDHCSSNNNNWDKAAIKKRKQFLKPQKKEIEKRNREVMILNIFEDGISLSNSPDSQKEYFYTDKGNFLRKNIFQNPTSCGSFALFRPNGQTLVRNGESSAWALEQHLKPETWRLFFSGKN